MAGDWIKWTKGLQDKPEVFRMSIELGLDRFSVAARLMVVWAWADDNVPADAVNAEGDASVAIGAQQKLLVDAVSGVPGFADSMSAVAWLLQRNGSLVFPNFSRHNGQTAKQRALSSERMQRSRDKAQQVLRPERNERATREEKNREEKKLPSEVNTPLPPQGGDGQMGAKKFDPRSVEIPEPLAGQAFAEAWELFCRHRTEKRKPMTATSTKLQLRQLAEWGAVRAIAAIQHTVAKGWLGIQEERTGGPAAGATTSQQDRREAALEASRRELEAVE